MMVIKWTAVLLLLASGAVTAEHSNVASVHGLLRGIDEETLLEKEAPATALTLDLLPREFSWRNVPGVGSLLTVGGNQHIPKYCGACYAFGCVFMNRAEA
jgi:hypothetical protein